MSGFVWHQLEGQPSSHEGQPTVVTSGLWQPFSLGDGSFLILGEPRALLVLQSYYVVLGAISEMST